MTVHTTDATGTNMSDEVFTYYESKFLERAKIRLVHREGMKASTHGQNSGETVQWDRYDPLTVSTTGLTQGSNPSEVDIADATVSATLDEYGTTVKVSKRLSLVSIDKKGAEKVSLVGQNMGEVLDTLARDAIFAGATTQLAGGNSALTDLDATDVLTATEIRKAVRTLDVNKAPTYSDGFYMGKIGAYTKFDLLNDSVWLNAKTYSDVKDLYQGEVGELHGVRFLVTNNQKTESSTVTVYSNFIHGDYALGEKELEGDLPKLYIKVPGKQDTSNPADRYSTISWAGSYVAKALISNWIINCKTGATA